MANKSYGVVSVGSTADLVFTLKNPNSGSENLTGLALTIDGPDAAEFSVTANPATTVAGGAGSSFTVRYAPAAPGMKTATLHIASNAEGSRNPYDIILTGASVPEIVLEQPTGTPLADGEGRSFPVAPTGSTADMIFTVKNPGGFELTGLGITIDGPDAGEFSVIASPVAPVAPGGSTAFTVRYTAASPAAKTATLHIASNVSGSRNPFDIVLTVVPGALDPTFNPSALTVTSITVQPDGKILAGGYSNGFNRVFPDGSREAAFVPNVNAAVNATALQNDGKIVIGGTFTMAGGFPHSRIARLNPDGTVDGAFSLNANNDVQCLAQQKDGKILVGGFFNTLGGATRNCIARLNADGSLDAGFNPNASGPVSSIATQEDGKIIIGGLFGAVDGVPRSRVARLNPDGSLDPDWNPGAGGEVRSITVQPDGKIIAGGLFTNAGFFARNRIARFNPNGSIDFGFDPDANGTVSSTVLQADGKILVAGEFSMLGRVTRNRIARLNPDGTVDAAFNPDASGTVHGIALQADGKILTGGTFSTIGGMSRFGFARLGNDPALQALTASGANRVDWLRDGSAPELLQVSFELSSDGGNTYSPLGDATRIPGGWEKTGLSLAASGHLRARGRTTGGTGNASSGLLETVAAFASETPEIVVEQPSGTDLADGGNASFGSVDLGETRSLTFTIKNSGTANLAPLTITKDGADAAMFTITASPIAVMPGGSTSLTVRFTPTGTGARTATLHIASNDGDENPFDLTLTGTGTLSTNADLSSLNLSSGPVTPAFAPGITSYGASVASAVTNITVTPTVAQSTATITVNGVAATSGIWGAPISLSVGSNTIAIVVTAGDGVTTMTYTITVTRAVPQPGDIEGEFDPRIFTSISTLAVQPDAKILLGASTFDQPLARLEANGSVESTATFNPHNGVTGSMLGTVVQADGKILVSVGGFLDNPIRRLNADGSVESAATFQPGVLSGGAAFGMALQSDGKIVLGGSFNSVNGQPRSFLARLLPNGAVETTATFNPGTGPDGTIYGVAVQADGKILLGGQFLSVNGQPRNGLARLNADGTLESAATFNPGIGPDNYVYWLAVQPDGKILVGGLFSTFNGQPRIGLARLLANGELDSNFYVDPGTGRVFSVAQQADGKMVLAGSFTTINGQPRPGIARLNADGTLESTTTFAPGRAANDFGGIVALQADGKILLTGNFENPGGGLRGTLVRLINDPALQSLTIPDSTRVQWARGGTAPELEEVTFELSTDGGNTYTALGAGTRIAGGWQKTGLSLPVSCIIRARGRFTDVGSGMVEQVAAFAPLTPLQQWKLTRLGDASAPDLDDPDGDGLANVVEFAYGLNPTSPDAGALPQLQLSGGQYEVSFATPEGVSGITYGAEWSSTMLPGSWAPIPDTGLGGQHSFSLPVTGPRQFLRLKVTAP